MLSTLSPQKSPMFPPEKIEPGMDSMYFMYVNLSHKHRENLTNGANHIRKCDLLILQNLHYIWMRKLQCKAGDMIGEHVLAYVSSKFLLDTKFFIKLFQALFCCNISFFQNGHLVKVSEHIASCIPKR